MLVLATLLALAATGLYFQSMWTGGLRRPAFVMATGFRQAKPLDGAARDSGDFPAPTKIEPTLKEQVDEVMLVLGTDATPRVDGGPRVEEIADFDAGRDVIVIEVANDEDPDLSFRDLPEGTILSLNGRAVARITGADSRTARAAIRVVVDGG